MALYIAVSSLLLLAAAPVVYGHGYLIEPPSRSSMWTLGISGSVANYDHNGLNCGGFGVSLLTVVHISEIIHITFT